MNIKKLKYIMNNNLTDKKILKMKNFNKIIKIKISVNQIN